MSPATTAGQPKGLRQRVGQSRLGTLLVLAVTAADSLTQALRLAGRRSWTHGAVFLTLWVWQCCCRRRAAGYFA